MQERGLVLEVPALDLGLMEGVAPTGRPRSGTKRRRYLEENVGAADVSLSTDEEAELDAALSPEKVAGRPYGPQQMVQVVS